MKLTVQQITEFYNEHPECIGKLKADTRHGYKTIEYADITAYDSDVIKIKTENNREIMCSPDHLFFNGEEWKKTSEYCIGDCVLTKTGKDKIISISLEPYKDDLYDLQIEEVKEFYANDFVSHNSSMQDALSFALFGKAHRNINKNQLINSINQKKALVELEFSIGKQEFLIRRGIKPAIFEIWQNGQMLNQSSTVKDYQKHLEQNILKLNYKSFHQVVVLGSSSFIPFMLLPAHHRREVIEDLLDIQIFSKMNVILKERLSKLKENINDTVYNIDLIKEKISMQEKYIFSVEQMAVDHIKEKDESIVKLRQQIRALKEQNSSLDTSISQLGSKSELVANEKDIRKLGNDLSLKQNSLKSQIAEIVSSAKFYKDNDTCPTCIQPISKEFGKQKIRDLKANAKVVEDEFAEVKAAIQKCKDRENDLIEKLKKIEELSFTFRSNNNKIDQIQNTILEIEKSKNELVNKNSDLVKAKDDLTKLLADQSKMNELHSKYLTDKQYLDAVMHMLKDTGIKTKIIKEYLPIINNLVNHYLNILDFFVSFNLDENFNESIKSRHRDEFTYSSFSEGERARINLALLFAWRQIARMKNSASTNLLIMDEVMDSSIDSDGIEGLRKILDSLPESSNVFIISHREELKSVPVFEQTIKFQKDGNFTKLKID